MSTLMNNTVPVKAKNKKKHAVKGQITAGQPAPVAVKKKPVAKKKATKKSPIEIVNSLHGKADQACKDYLSQQRENGTVLKNKTALGILWHCFNAFNEKTTQDALQIQHTCAPQLYYKNATSDLVSDATNGKHYCCTAFKHYYSEAKPNDTHKKHIVNLLNNFDSSCSGILKLWNHLGDKTKLKGFKEYLEKISK